MIRFDKNGSLDAEKTDKLLNKRLSKCENAVVPGFYGAKEDGSVTTFSRGGSDVTGSLVEMCIRDSHIFRTHPPAFYKMGKKPYSFLFSAILSWQYILRSCDIPHSLSAYTEYLHPVSYTHLSSVSPPMRNIARAF